METLRPQDRLGIGGDDRPNPYFNGVGSPSKSECVEPMQDDTSLTQKVFAKLMTDPENSLCLDCGKSLAQNRSVGFPNPEYVSVNNGVFLCFNCACGIHTLHYGMEVSFIKPITSPTWCS